MNYILVKSEDQIIKIFRKYMKRKGITQGSIAKKFDYDTSTVNAWFCKRSRLKLDACVAICDALDMEIILRKKEDDKNEK